VCINLNIYDSPVSSSLSLGPDLGIIVSPSHTPPVCTTRRLLNPPVLRFKSVTDTYLYVQFYLSVTDTYLYVLSLDLVYLL
jgi:hypothetical protein